MNTIKKSFLVGVTVVTSLGMVLPTFAHTLAIKNPIAIIKQERNEIKKDLKNNIEELRKKSQEEERRLVTVEGTLTAKTDTQLSLELTKFVPLYQKNALLAPALKTTLAVTVTANTSIQGKNGAKLSLADLALTDQLTVAGRMNTDGTLTALTIKDRTKAMQAYTVRGTIATLTNLGVPTSFTIVVSNPLSLSPIDSTVTVMVDAQTKFTRLYNGVSTLPEFSVGDVVAIKGTFSTSSILTAQTIHNESIRASDKKGIITAIDASTQTVTLNWSDKVVAKIVAGTTILLSNNATGTFSNLVVGQSVHIKGVLNLRTQSYVAREVKVTNQTIVPFAISFKGVAVATPSATLPSTFMVKISSLSSDVKHLPEGWRPFVGERQVSVTIDSNTAIFDRNWNRISLASFLANDKLSLGGQVQVNGTALVTFLRDESYPHPVAQ